MLRFERPDQTSAVVHFTRNSQGDATGGARRRLSAVAMLLSGIDRQADARAVARGIELVEGARMRVDVSQAPSWVEGVRPVALIVCAHAAALSDPSNHLIFSAAAQAFFAQLGAERPAQPGG